MAYKFHAVSELDDAIQFQINMLLPDVQVHFKIGYAQLNATEEEKTIKFIQTNVICMVNPVRTHNYIVRILCHRIFFFFK